MLFLGNDAFVNQEVLIVVVEPVPDLAPSSVSSYLSKPVNMGPGIGFSQDFDSLSVFELLTKGMMLPSALAAIVW
jgi:hypothetical protein